MAKWNGYQPWTIAATDKLRRLASINTPRRIIARELGRTVNAITRKASSLSIYLAPYGKK